MPNDRRGFLTLLGGAAILTLAPAPVRALDADQARALRHAYQGARRVEQIDEQERQHDHDQTEREGVGQIELEQSRRKVGRRRNDAMERRKAQPHADGDRAAQLDQRHHRDEKYSQIFSQHNKPRCSVAFYKR